MRDVVSIALAFLLLASTLAGADQRPPDVYVRSRSVPLPREWHGSDCYVPVATISALFGDRLKSIAIDDHGMVMLDGRASQMHAIGRGLVPLLACSKALGFEVLENRAVGIIDVIAPRKERLENVRRAEPPVDEREAGIAEAGTRHLVELYPIYWEPKMVARVERIGQNLARACPRSSLHWTFQVLNTRKVNAMSVGLGRIFVTRGLVEQSDDDELAGALGHEIAHTCLRHSTRAHDQLDEAEVYLRRAAEARKRAASAQQAGDSPATRMVAADATREAREYVTKARETVKHVGDQDSHWNEEYEADRAGMTYVHDAGYRPQGLIECLQKLQVSMTDEKVLRSIEGVSSHPPLPTRIAIAQKVYASYYGQPGGRR